MRSLLALLFCTSAPAENLIEVVSKVDGRTYLIDTDSRAIRSKLYSVSGVKASVPSVPEWLLPFAGATPMNVSRAAINGESIQADFRAGGTMRQVADYYDQLLRSRRFRTVNRHDRLPLQITIQADNGAERVALRFSEQNGSVQLHLSYHVVRQGVIGGAVPRMKMAPLSYDDTNGILYLRDAVSGQDFYLRKRTIVNEDYNRLEEHQDPAQVARLACSLSRRHCLRTSISPTPMSRHSKIACANTAPCGTRRTVRMDCRR